MTEHRQNRPTGTPEPAVLVLTQWEDDICAPVVRGVFASLRELREVVGFLLGTDALDEDELVLVPLTSEEDDSDVVATAELLVRGEEERRETGLFVWDSARKRAAHAPLKLFWCTTEDGNEDWFMIAHTASEAALEHAAAEGYDPDDASAEFVMQLPAELQVQGDELVGWPQHDVLRACGARFLREKSPRVIELAGRTFAEGMLDAEIEKIRDDAIRTDKPTRYD